MMGKSRYIKKEIKDKILVDCMHRCCLCPEHQEILDLHHVIPISEDGPNSEENLMAICPTCHAKIHRIRGRYNKEQLGMYKARWIELCWKKEIPLKEKMSLAPYIEETEVRTVDEWTKLRIGSMDLRGAKFKNLDFSERDLSGWNLSNLHLKGANFYRTILDDAKLINSNLRDADFGEASMKGAELTDSTLRSATLFRANLLKAKLVNVSLRDANLVEANLKDADLSKSNLKGCDIQETIVEGADLSGIKVDENSEIFEMVQEFERKNLLKKSRKDKSIPKMLEYSLPDYIETLEEGMVKTLAILHECSVPYRYFNITSQHLNWKSISTEILSNESGTISIWVEVTKELLNPDTPNKIKYLLSYSTSKVKKEARYYPNSLSLRRMEGKNGVVWKVVFSNDNDKRIIPEKNSLSEGWHLFSITWSKKRNSVIFSLDGIPANGEGDYEFWPKEILRNDMIYIGKWITKQKCFYINSNVGPWIIYKKAITINEIKKYYQLVHKVLNEKSTNKIVVKNKRNIPKKIEIEHGRKQSLLIDMAIIRISFKARIDYPHEAGNAHLLIVRVNNVILDRKYILNKGEMKKFSPKPREETWFDREIKAWHLCYSPDFMSNYSIEKYRVIDDDPYEFEFDISSIKPDVKNQYLIEFEHSGLKTADGYFHPVVVKDIIVE